MENKQTVEEFLKKGGEIKTFTEDEAKKLKEENYKNPKLTWYNRRGKKTPPHKVE